jgi:hypothetical protein
MPGNTIIFVHGRGLKPPKDIYHQDWVSALCERVHPELHRDLASCCGMAYYADVFYSPTSVAGGQSKDAQGLLLSALLDRFGRQLTPDPSLALAPLLGGIEHEASLFLEDVLKYFAWRYNGRIGQPLRSELESAAQRGDRIMLVSHSLGTMVAYDVLSDRPYHVDTWVTLGSPLGWTQGIWARVPQNLVSFVSSLGTLEPVLDRTVLSFLRARQENPTAPLVGPSPRLEYPVPTDSYPDSATVDRWINITDPGDPIAVLDAFLADDFPMPDTSLRAMDVAVRNPDRRPGDKASAHSDLGYLRTWQVAQVVTDFLRRQR